MGFKRMKGRSVYISSDEMELLKLALDAMEISYSEHLTGRYRCEEDREMEERHSKARISLSNKLEKN